MALTTKYKNSHNEPIVFQDDVIERNVIRLTNQVWKLIPMRENNEDWSKQLQTVIIEVAGMCEVFATEKQPPQLLQLLNKLEGLSIIDTTFGEYRKTIFEAINLLRELVKEDDKE